MTGCSSRLAHSHQWISAQPSAPINGTKRTSPKLSRSHSPSANLVSLTIAGPTHVRRPASPAARPARVDRSALRHMAPARRGDNCLIGRALGPARVPSPSTIVTLHSPGAAAARAPPRPGPACAHSDHLARDPAHHRCRIARPGADLEHPVPGATRAASIISATMYGCEMVCPERLATDGRHRPGGHIQRRRIPPADLPKSVQQQRIANSPRRNLAVHMRSRSTCEISHWPPRPTEVE